MHALVVSWSFCSKGCVSCSSSLHHPVLLHFWLLSKSLFGSCLSCQLPFIKASLRGMSTKSRAASASFPCRDPYQGPIKKAFLPCNYRNKWHTQSFNSYPSIHHRLGEGVQNSPTSSCFSANSAFLLAHSTFKFNAQQTKVDRNQWTNVNLWGPSQSPVIILPASFASQAWIKFLKSPWQAEVSGKFWAPQQLQLRLLLSSLLEFSICLFLSKNQNGIFKRQRCWSQKRNWPLLISAESVDNWIWDSVYWQCSFHGNKESCQPLPISIFGKKHPSVLYKCETKLW